MKIKKFNEKISPEDDIFYKGQLIINFKISRSEYYDGLRSYYNEEWLKKNEKNEILKNYLKNCLTLFESTSTIVYDAVDKDDNPIDEELYDDSKNFNL